MTAKGRGTARLFVAVWPPPEVCDALAALGRPDDDSDLAPAAAAAEGSVARALALAGGLAGLATAFAVRTRRTIAVPVLGACAGAVLAVGTSDWIAPVPLRIEHGVFSRGVRGKCPVDTLRSAQPGSELWAWTPVFAPSGLTDTVFHVWSRDGRELARIPLPLHGGRKEGFRTWSSSRRAAASAGDVELEVVTAGGQLVGAMTISVR